MDKRNSASSQGGEGSGYQKPALPARALKQAPETSKRDIDWLVEEVDYSVAEFYEQFQNNLPKTVIVSEGFCGDIIDDIFDRGQVLRIVAISKQQRVVAKFRYLRQLRLISIPESHDEKLCVVSRSGQCGKPKSVYTILEENVLPIVARFPQDQTITVGNQTVGSNNIPVLQLKKTFEEVYLLGNFILNETMSEDVVAVPLYLSQLRLALVTGIKDQPKEAWTKFQEKLDRISTYIEYDQQYGNPNIAEYDPNAIHSENAYTYVEPRLYSNIARMVQRTCPTSFDNIAYNPELYQKDYREVDNFVSSTMNDTGDKKETQPLHKQDLKQALKIERVKAEKREDMAPLLTPHRQEMNLVDGAMKVAKHSNTKPSAVPIAQEKTVFSETEIHYQDEGNNVYEELDKTAMDDFVSNSKSKPCPPLIAPKPQVKTPHIAPDSYKKMGVPPALPGRKPATNQQQNFQRSGDKTAIYSNDIPRGQISPTVHKEHADTEKTNSLETETVVRELKSSEDVEKLSIQEIATYLEKLKLEKYTDTFRDQLIDGRMLISLDKDILKEEFGMTAIEALRLTNFSKDGHIPT